MDGFTAPPNTTGNQPTANTGGGFSVDGFQTATPQSEKIWGYNQEQTPFNLAVKNASGFGILKNTITGIPAAAESFGKGALDVVDSIATKTWNTYKETPSKIADDINQAVITNNKAMANDKGNAGAALVDTGKVLWKGGARPALDIANAIFAPLSAAIGTILDKTGGQKLEDGLGNTIADKSGITDNKAFQQFALSHPNFGEDFMRLITGVMSAGETGKIDPAKTVGEIHGLASKLIEQAKSPEPVAEAPTRVPVKSTLEFNKGNGANPQLKSAFEANFKTKPTLGQTLDGFDNSGVKTETPTQPPTAPNAPEDVRQTLPDGTKVAKSASDINATLVKKGFDALPPEEQAKYSPGSYSDEAANVANLMDTDIQKATDMATGDTPLEGIKYPQILFNAIEAKATADGDAATLMKLAKSPFSTQLSESGATLGSHGFNDNPNSPVDAIKSVQAAREAYAEKSASKGTAPKQDIIKSGIDEANKATTTKQSWSDFVDSIKCNY